PCNPLVIGRACRKRNGNRPLRSSARTGGPQSGDTVLAAHHGFGGLIPPFGFFYEVLRKKMKSYSFSLAFVMVICVTTLSLPASAIPPYPLADPGFSYVDVNNDGMYNPDDGDIGLASTPSVDIDAL